MAVSRIDGAKTANTVSEHSARMLTLSIDASAEMAIGADWPQMLFVDPAGGAKTILLPAEEDGMIFYIVNTADAAEALTVEEDSSTTAIATIAQGEMAVIVCSGTTWYSLVGTNT